jgi:hypothetical protein
VVVEFAGGHFIADLGDHVGFHRGGRQLFLVDHAGLPLKTVLEQLDLLGGEVVPVLRKEFQGGRPADVPAGPTHESLVKAVAEEDRQE